MFPWAWLEMNFCKIILDLNVERKPHPEILVNSHLLYLLNYVEPGNFNGFAPKQPRLDGFYSVFTLKLFWFTWT